MSWTATTVGTKPEQDANGVSCTQAPDACCFHCGTPCRGVTLVNHDKAFCCQGCLTVFELLSENGLGDFYRMSENAGVRVRASDDQTRFAFLDEPAVRARLADYTDDRITRVRFHLPAIHCISCVWLLENLFRLNPGIGQSQVNFPRKEVAITFDNARVKLSEVVLLLSSLGYEPELKLSDLDGQSRSPISRRLWLQLGVAGFAFGNIMLFSISLYLGMDRFSGGGMRHLFGYLSLLLALPVFVYSAADYWRAAWLSLKQRILTIEVPIAVGVLALFVESVYEVISGRGEGYFDSMTGLLFFLLCGKLFQQKTYDRLAFDRDYKSFFPLSVVRKQANGEAHVSLEELKVGDRLIIRSGELIPADAQLVDGPAIIDYSFVTGESEPQSKKPGDHLYAGGRQVGGAIEIETIKAVSQGYLTSLWNQDVFRKAKNDTLDTLTNIYSRRFTRIIITIAVGAALFWEFAQPQLALKAFTSVLIVACPCALALAAPFALGSAQRVLARRNIFLRNANVIEALARVNTVVFDKTGTLTAAGADSVAFHGQPLTHDEESFVFALTRHSTHPYAVRIGEAIRGNHDVENVRSFCETTGCGMEGSVGGREIWLGSGGWFGTRHVSIPALEGVEGGVVHVALDGKYRGSYVLTNGLRPRAQELIQKLSERCQLALLSGDNERERAQFSKLFGKASQLLFNQSPLHKLSFIQKLQAAGQTVMMVGDGLNDAGALKQSDVGVAVVEKASAFSPASDVILAADMVPHLSEVLEFSQSAVRVVRWSFVISSIYNVLGVSIAARGLLSPVVCAILMPLSSITVVAFACGVTTWLGRKLPASAPAVQEIRKTEFYPAELTVSEASV